MAAKRKRKGAGVPAEYRGERGRFLPGCPPGPGRPNARVEMANLQAVASVLTPDLWKRLTMLKVRKALKGDPQAFEWCEKHGLLGRTIADLQRELETEGKALDLEGKELLDLNEMALKSELIRLVKKARESELTAEESERVLEIRRVLSEAREVEKLPDLGGGSLEEAEERYLKIRGEEKKR